MRPARLSCGPLALFLFVLCTIFPLSSTVDYCPLCEVFSVSSSVCVSEWLCGAAERFCCSLLLHGCLSVYMHRETISLALVTRGVGLFKYVSACSLPVGCLWGPLVTCAAVLHWRCEVRLWCHLDGRPLYRS